MLYPQQKIDSSELMQCNGPGRGRVGQVGRPNMAGLIGRRIIPSNGNATGIPAGRVGSGRVAIFGTGRVRVRVSITFGMSTGRVAEMLDPHIPTWGVREIYQGVTTSTLAHGLLLKTSKHSMEIRIDRQIDRSSSHSRIYPAPPPKKKVTPT